MARPQRRPHRRNPDPRRLFSLRRLSLRNRTNGLLNLAYVGIVFLAGAVLTLGVGLIRAARRMP